MDSTYRSKGKYYPSVLGDHTLVYCWECRRRYVSTNGHGWSVTQFSGPDETSVSDNPDYSVLSYPGQIEMRMLRSGSISPALVGLE